MIYVTERVTNIAELEGTIRSAYQSIAAIRAEIEKENPSMDQIDELSKQAHMCLFKAKDFEFCVERRKTIYQHDPNTPAKDKAERATYKTITQYNGRRKRLEKDNTARSNAGANPDL